MNSLNFFCRRRFGAVFEALAALSLRYHIGPDPDRHKSKNMAPFVGQRARRRAARFDVRHWAKVHRHSGPSDLNPGLHFIPWPLKSMVRAQYDSR